MAKSNNTLTISILDRDFRINCPADSQHELTSAAQLLDEKMREISNASNTPGQVVGIDRIAVIAALNIAHQLQQLQGKQTQLNLELERIDERLDEALMQEPKIER